MTNRIDLSNEKDVAAACLMINLPRQWQPSLGLRLRISTSATSSPMRNLTLRSLGLMKMTVRHLKAIRTLLIARLRSRRQWLYRR